VLAAQRSETAHLAQPDHPVRSFLKEDTARRLDRSSLP
jgi:hypothetical protein